MERKHILSCQPDAKKGMSKSRPNSNPGGMICACHFPAPARMLAGKHRILVVDASEANRSLLGECLVQLEDVCTIYAADGAQALAAIQASPPSLILLDMHLRDTDGISLVRRIRSLSCADADDTEIGWIPIIFLSPLMNDEMVARGILAGGDDFLAKPVSEVILLAKIRAMLRIVGMQQDIRAAHRRLKQISTLDGLTCIPNRRYFDETLEIEWKRCMRAGAPLSLILADVDYFKPFNDIYGHQAGDQCLKAVAGAMSEALFRVEDSVARYGGEEFAVILPGTTMQGANAVGERMRNAIRELRIPHESGVGTFVSCSFGIVDSLQLDDASPTNLLRAADQSLYLAKNRGRNRIESCMRPLYQA